MGMIRTGEEYRAVLRDGRELWIDGERVQDVTGPPRVQTGRRPQGTHIRHGARAGFGRNNELPRGQPTFFDLVATADRKDALAREVARDRHLSERHSRHPDRVGDETVGEMWS